MSDKPLSDGFEQQADEFAELEQLAWSVLDQRSDAADVQRLDAFLAGNARLQRYYLSLCDQHFEYQRRALAAPGLASDKRTPPAAQQFHDSKSTRDTPNWLDSHPPRQVWRTIYYVASNYTVLSLVVSGLFFAVLLLSMAQIVLDWKRFVPGNELEQPAFVARITDTQNATWDKSSDGNFLNIDLFAGEQLVLNSGLATIIYDTGATVVLEGPATYEIHSHNSGHLKIGHLTARINEEQAKGFSIHTPTARIEDLGTEFGVHVDRAGTTNAVVMEGKIRVGARGGMGRGEVLNKGQAVKIQFVSQGNGLREIEISRVAVASVKLSPRMSSHPEPVLDGSLVLQPLSTIYPGSERVSLISNGGFRDQGLEQPPGSGGFPFPIGWSRQNDMFTAKPPASVNVPSTSRTTMAIANIDGDVSVGAYSRTIELRPDTEYVLSAYLWNLGDEDHLLHANVDLRDTTGEANLRLKVDDHGATEGCFAYQSFNTSDTGTRLLLRVFYDAFKEVDDDWPHFPVGAMWDNIAITPVATFRPPFLRGTAHEEIDRVE